MAYTNENWKEFLSGDYRAFKSLYEGYYTILKQYAVGYSKDENLASESVQDLFVKLWNNRATLSHSPESLKHYLIKAQRHIIINKLSKRSRERYVGHTDELLAASHDWAAFEEDLPSFSIEMQRLIDRLTDRQREAIYLFYSEDYSYRELAEHFDIQVTAAYKLIYRALDFLKIAVNERTGSSDMRIKS
ncbi:MAG: RNA polymerase sigma factor [Sphingobacterium sp.]